MAVVFAPLVAAVGGTAFAVGTTLNLVVSTGLALVSTTALQYYIAQANQPKQKTGTKLEMESGGAVPLSITFGTCETAGSLIYLGTWGKAGKTPNAYMTKVMALSDLPGDIDDRIWIEGEDCTISATTGADGAGNSMGRKVTGKDIWIKVISAATSVDPFLSEQFGSGSDRNWAGIGRNKTLMVVTARYNNKEPSGFPSVRARFTGNDWYDLRSDSTNGGSGSQRYGTRSTYGAANNNPITAAYNVMRGVYRGTTWVYGGKAWPAKRFDNASWIAAAQKCDEDVERDGTTAKDKRYRIGGEVAVNEEPLDVIDRFMAACNGTIIESGGVIKVSVGGAGLSVYSFTDDDIIVSEEMTGTQLAGYDKSVNTITGTYTEPDNGGQAKAYKPRTKQDYIDADGEVLTAELSNPYVRNNRQMQRLAKHALEDARRVVTWRLTLPPGARKLEPCDVVSWTSDSKGYTAKKFICGDVMIRSDGLVTVDLREVDPSDADWVAGDEDAYTVGVYTDVVPSTQPTVVTVTSWSLKDKDDNDRIPAVKLEWDVDADDVDAKFIRWQIQHVKGTSTSSPKGDIVSAGVVNFDENITDGIGTGRKIITDGLVMGEFYRIRAKLVPESDRLTEWTDWSPSDAEAYFTAGTFSRRVIASDLDPTVPDQVTWPATDFLFQRQELDYVGRPTQYFFANFNDPTSRNSYQVEADDGTDKFYFSGDNAPIKFPVEIGKTYDVRVRARSWARVWGDWSTTKTKEATNDIDAPSQLSGLKAFGQHGQIRVEWDPYNAKNYRDTIIKAAQKTGVSDPTYADANEVYRGQASAFVHDNLGNKETWFYWGYHRDNGRDQGVKYPDGSDPDVKATTKRLVNDDYDDDSLDTPKIKRKSITVGPAFSMPARTFTNGKFISPVPNGRNIQISDVPKNMRYGFNNQNPSMLIMDIILNVSGKIGGSYGTRADITFGVKDVTNGVVLGQIVRTDIRPKEVGDHYENRDFSYKLNDTILVRKVTKGLNNLIFFYKIKMSGANDQSFVKISGSFAFTFGLR